MSDGTAVIALLMQIQRRIERELEEAETMILRDAESVQQGNKNRVKNARYMLRGFARMEVEVIQQITTLLGSDRKSP